MARDVNEVHTDLGMNVSE